MTDKQESLVRKVIKGFDLKELVVLMIDEYGLQKVLSVVKGVVMATQSANKGE